MEKTPENIAAIRPLKDGVIANFEVTQEMLKHFINKAYSNKKKLLIKPSIVIGVPSGATDVEKRAVIDVAISAGAKEAILIEEPMAAAIGSGLPVHEAIGSLVVDIGGGTTEIAVLSLGGIVTSVSIRVGGDELDASIVSYIKKEYSLMIGDRTAEKVKIQIGSAYVKLQVDTMEIHGRDLITGLPKSITIKSHEIANALEEPINSIMDGIKTTLEKTPPELSADIMIHGILLTGGGALLHGLCKLIHKETNMPVHTAENALDCVVDGTHFTINNL